MEKYPLYIDGDKRGELSVYTDGLMTVFDARCDKAAGIVKLYVFGVGQKAYLGTMQPAGKGLRLIKKLSRAGLKGFPENIEYAGSSELKQSEPEIEDEADILWHRSQNGCLVGCDGEKNLIAIPASGVKLAMHKKILRTIDGRKYLIFPGKRKL